jgi:phytoene synthase
MCRLFGVTDPAVLERARALGHAMQLTNITRDVGEDLRLNRIYLPQALLADHGIMEEDLRRMQSVGRSSVEYQVLLRELIDRANVLYEYAENGIPALPRGFRSAVAVASNVYRGIHAEVVRNEFNNLTKRARTSRRSKFRLAAKAIWWLRRQDPEFADTAPTPPASVQARSGLLEVVDQ